MGLLSLIGRLGPVFFLFAIILSGCGDSAASPLNQDGIAHNVFLHLTDGTPIDDRSYLVPGQREILQPQLNELSTVLSRYEYRQIDFQQTTQLSTDKIVVLVYGEYRLKETANWHSKAPLLELHLSNIAPGWRVNALKLLLAETA